MKKVVLILAAAAAVAACAKNEVITDFANGENEITFNVAPKTKALGTNQSDFDHNNVFKASAFYLGKDKTWANDALEATLYIAESEISYNSDVWKNATTSYYWPKDGGSLTFLAFSYNKNDLELAQETETPSNFSIEKPTIGQDGKLHYGVNGAIDVIANKNVDFLVADIAADKTGNDKTYDHNGVPTLFKHKLSQVVFNAKVDQDYADKTFEINEITFENLPFYGMYNQFPETMTVGTDNAKAANQSYAKDVAQVVTTTNTKVDAKVKGENTADTDGQYLYVPQAFTNTNRELVIKYTVTTVVAGSTPVVENCEARLKIEDKFASWEMGKRYIFNIKFGLNEITWDPAVEGWEDVNTSEITIE